MKLTVAAVQAASANGDVAGNLVRATPLVERAAREGAQLIVCPEFLATGYAFEPAVWDCAEKEGGPTETWLRAQATKHGVTIGASWLEATGDDFFNTFTLVEPDGAVAGRVRKESMPAWEGWFCKSSDGPKTISTKLGRIGVGICQDNHTARFMRRMADDAPDIVVMPHSGPCLGPTFAHTILRAQISTVGTFYAESFGVPVVVVNKAAGPAARTAIPWVPFLRVSMRFPGLSSICDARGKVLGRLDDREDVIVAEVDLGTDVGARAGASARPRPRAVAVPNGYWARPPPSIPGLSALFFRVFERVGKSAYEASTLRRRKARAVSA